MSDPNSVSARVAELAEEFIDRQRLGERPSLREYIERHPDLAEEIRQVFPAMAMMEHLALDDETPGGDAAACASAPRCRSWSSLATTGSSARSGTVEWGSSTRPSRSRWAATWP